MSSILLNLEAKVESKMQKIYLIFTKFNIFFMYNCRFNFSFKIFTSYFLFCLHHDTWVGQLSWNFAIDIFESSLKITGLLHTIWLYIWNISNERDILYFALVTDIHTFRRETTYNLFTYLSNIPFQTSITKLGISFEMAYNMNWPECVFSTVDQSRGVSRDSVLIWISRD